MNKLEISLKEKGATISLNGANISTAVRGMTIECHVNSYPQVELELALIDVTTVGSLEAEYLLTSATRDALLAMGWTPPAAGQ